MAINNNLITRKSLNLWSKLINEYGSWLYGKLAWNENITADLTRMVILWCDVMNRYREKKSITTGFSTFSVYESKWQLLHYETCVDREFHKIEMKRDILKCHNDFSNNTRSNLESRDFFVVKWNVTMAMKRIERI